jgi:hypothetical protein
LNRIRVLVVRRFVLIIAAAAVLPGWAHAEEAAPSKAMRLTVSPSGYEESPNEALERQQKLLKRMEQSAHMVRSICVNCGDGWKHQIYTPFEPLASLGASRQVADEAGN